MIKFVMLLFIIMYILLIKRILNWRIEYLFEMLFVVIFVVLNDLFLFVCDSLKFVIRVNGFFFCILSLFLVENIICR